jgi:hypothetical protein
MYEVLYSCFQYLDDTAMQRSPTPNLRNSAASIAAIDFDDFSENAANSRRTHYWCLQMNGYDITRPPQHEVCMRIEILIE